MTLAVVGAAGTAAAVWGIGIERHLYTLRRHEVRVLPEGAAPLRVLHISDAHMAPWQRRKQEWIASLAEFAPHLVIDTGDNLGHVDALDGIRRAYDPLRGIPGFFVHGSNDHEAPSPRNPFKYFSGPSAQKREPVALDTPALEEYLVGDLGWTDLNNAVGAFDVQGLRIAGLGVADAHRDWDDLALLDAPLADLRADDAPDLTIGVTHAPYRRVLDRFVDLGADMLFGGHTHGGQVRMPGVGALVANCDIPLRQARGLSTWAHGGRAVPLNVSAGLGHSIYAPVRFACRPEASLITLLPRA
ncbi:metallophosphoesterase [Microbacterium koreense]|uniref:Metallophosphoesterase n=1 Tax=Microbacterium koreense TaxID=323761 RepID=A0ABW2ZQ96_9MICO